VGDEKTGPVGKHARRRALVAIRRSRGHKRIVAASHMEAAIMKYIERILNTPIKHVNPLARNLRERGGERINRVRERAVRAVTLELRDVLI